MAREPDQIVELTPDVVVDNGDGTHSLRVLSTSSGGGGGAVTIADGADVALGAKADAAATGDGSVVAILKRLRTLLNGGLPAALGAGGGVKIDGSGTAVPVSGTVTVTGVATEATLDARTGSLTETAPGTDTASSGLNGRLQRIAQRLTSAITLLGGGLPAALAAGGGLKVEGVAAGVAVPVTFPAYTAPASGELAGATGATQMPNIACKLVMFAAEASNAGKVYIGISGVTKPDGSTDTTTGFELAAGQATQWIPIDNLNRLYRICDNAGDDLTYLLVA